MTHFCAVLWYLRKKAILFKKKNTMKNNSKRLLYFLTMVSLMILLNACRAAGCGCPMH
jgi:uncharacterized membrane protein SirB2